ncbi:AAA domain-containing protein [Rhizobium sp. PP-CC-2G-626]|nr:AAA domain-containing protein [Rhizobium sp. PP-CC-2G-626]
MTIHNVNAGTTGDTAPLKNIATCLGMIRSLQNRHPVQPNLGVFAGYSGYGKSVSALYCQNKTGAIYVEISDTWKRKKLMQMILSEVGHYQPKGTLSDLEDQVIGALARDPKRPVIIDEADKLINNNLFELVRMIAKKSGVPFLLIGEELFPTKLEQFGDRFRDLVLVSEFAQPCDLEDVRALARTFYPHLSIADDLLDQCRAKGDGRARRIGNSLHAIASEAASRGLTSITLGEYSGLFSGGSLPARRDRKVA